MSNPYEPPEAAPQVDEGSEVLRVNVRPIEQLYQAKAMLGDQFWLFCGICFVAIFVGSAVPIVLLGPMLCGVFYCFIKKEQGPVTFDMLFRGFDYFGDALLATLVVVGVAMLIEIPAGIFWMVVSVGGVAMNDGEFPPWLFGVLPLLYVVVFALIMVIQVPFTFVYPLIVDRKMKAWPAVKLSWQGARKNFWGILGMVLVYSLLGMVAACMCYVPVFFLLPLSFGSTFLLYRQVFPGSNPADKGGD